MLTRRMAWAILPRSGGRRLGRARTQIGRWVCRHEHGGGELVSIREALPGAPGRGWHQVMDSSCTRARCSGAALEHLWTGNAVVFFWRLAVRNDAFEHSSARGMGEERVPR